MHCKVVDRDHPIIAKHSLGNIHILVGDAQHSPIANYFLSREIVSRKVRTQIELPFAVQTTTRCTPQHMADTLNAAATKFSPARQRLLAEPLIRKVYCK
jgi:hypothetical protein